MTARSSQAHQPDTLPLAGRAGEGGATRSGPATLAQKLRLQSTAPERRLWRLLFPFRTDGFHFRKQQQIGAYVVDFACLHAGLIIEVDGETHGGEIAQSNDAVRDDYLRGRGFHVLGSAMTM
ncbi:endonuclease domain-containing protein [Devosia sp.]|uniref:endonuclease domain-containing protein n=1 Tax=Devosia sp. TaxID=1871048 RepID=UPI003BAC87C2